MNICIRPAHGLTPAQIGGTKTSGDAPLASEVTWNEPALGAPVKGGGTSNARSFTY